MKIYTRTGDDGTTGLFGKARVSKDDIRIEAYGTVDELNSHIGVLTGQLSPGDLLDELQQIQHSLFDLGSHLASDGSLDHLLPVWPDDAEGPLEGHIDRMNESLPELRNFILPGGTVSSSQAHLCRTVCRRAERRIVSLQNQDDGYSRFVNYLNRLSDYFFVLARYLNHQSGQTDVTWQK